MNIFLIIIIMIAVFILSYLASDGKTKVAALSSAIAAVLSIAVGFIPLDNLNEEPSASIEETISQESTIEEIAIDSPEEIFSTSEITESTTEAINIEKNTLQNSTEEEAEYETQKETNTEKKERTITKTSFSAYEEGWTLVDYEVEWKEWTTTASPKYMVNSDTYEVRKVSDKKTKQQYYYYNWWYYNGDVKMFSSDNNGGIIPDSQYWGQWFDYTMESVGYIEMFDSEDNAKYWWNKSNNDCRYLGDQREVEVEPALYEEREGTGIYTHQKTIYE